jgi:hypothetical protein
MSAYSNVTTRIGLAVALAFAASSLHAEAIDKRAAADPRGEVEIVNVAGSVHVRGWDKPEVAIEGDVEERNRLEFSSQGSRTIIRVVSAGDRRGRSGEAELIVRVPEASALSVNTTSANQAIKGVKGRQRLQSVSGDIDTQVAAEDLFLKSISGDVLVTGTGSGSSSGLRRVTTVSGDLTLSKISGEIEVETVSGDMRIDAGELTRARINTTSGDMRITAQLAKEARVDIETINGDVEFKLAGPIDGEFNIHTFNGDIKSCFGNERVRNREFGPGRDLDFTQGAGSARVRIKTLNGDIDLCRR